jgi:hypothetical protein
MIMTFLIPARSATRAICFVRLAGLDLTSAQSKGSNMSRLLSLLGAVLLPLLLLTAAVSPTVAFDIQIGPKTASLINTIQLCSTSGSTVAANTPSPPMFPLEFKKGDVPAGQYPQLQATDGTSWGATFINIRHWSDGSMKIAGVLPGPFPKAIPTGCVDAKVLSGGIAPAASGLTPPQMYSEQIQLNANGFAGALGSGLSHTGDWSAKLANDVNNVEVVNYGDGQGGRVYRILTHVQQGGTAHGQMEVYWYVQQLLDASGGLAGYRVLPRLTQPWYNHDTPAKDWRGLKDFNIQYGAGPTTITPPFPQQAVHLPSSEWSAGNDWHPASVPASWMNCDGESCQVAGYFTTTGTLPTGYQVNHPYCAFYLGYASLIRFYSCNGPFAVDLGTATSGGSGTHTFHPIPLLLHFGTLWGAQEDGRYTYIQGSGSASADAPIIVKRDPVYDQSTKLWPPYDMSLSPRPDPNRSSWNGVLPAFNLQQSGTIPWLIDGTGESDSLGIRSAYCARWFYNRTSIDERYVRILGLSSGLFANAIRDITTRGPVHLGNPSKTYTGMPASLATSFDWSGFNKAGFTPPANSPVALFFATRADTPNGTSHMPDLAGCAYLATGEPQYLDLAMEWANDAIYSHDKSTRNASVGGEDYYGITTYKSGEGFRDNAWALRMQADGAAWWPDTDPVGTQIGAYLRDQLSASTRLGVATIALENDWARDNCYWLVAGGGGRGSWHYSYMINALVAAANGAEDSDAMSLLNCSARWFSHALNTFGGYTLYSYLDLGAYDIGAQPFGPFGQGTLSWSVGTATLTTDGDQNFFTGEKLFVDGALRTITRTGPTTATFPLTTDPGGPRVVGYQPIGQPNSSDATYVNGYGTSPQTSVVIASWRAGNPGSWAVTYADYSAYIGKNGGESWNPVDGDKYLFNPVSPGIGIIPPPGGLEVHKPYYTVNTHAGPISNTAWASGTLTVTTVSPHGITIGDTVMMGINGNNSIGGYLNINPGPISCTIITSTQFTCPVATDPGPPSGRQGTYNTAQLAASPGGEPLAITNTGTIANDFGSVPVNPPSGYWVGFSDPSAYLPNAYGAFSALVASGATGMNAVVADAANRLAYTRSYLGSGSFGDYFRSNPKNAMQTSFGAGGSPPSPRLIRPRRSGPP